MSLNTKDNFYFLYQTEFYDFVTAFGEKVIESFKELGLECTVIKTDIRANSASGGLFLRVEGIPMRLAFGTQNNDMVMYFQNWNVIVRNCPEIAINPDNKKKFHQGHFIGFAQVAKYFEDQKLKEIVRPKLRGIARTGMLEHLKSFENF